MSITANYTIQPTDSQNLKTQRFPVLQVDPTSNAITLTLPPTQTTTAGIALSKWTITVLNNTNPVTLADHRGENTIYPGNSAAFVSTANLVAGTYNLRYDGLHFVFDA